MESELHGDQLRLELDVRGVKVHSPPSAASAASGPSGSDAAGGSEPKPLEVNVEQPVLQWEVRASASHTMWPRALAYL